MGTQVLERPDVITSEGTGLTFEPMYQVILWNDDVNSFQYVIAMLQKIFGHNRQMAEKIANDANNNGKTIAEVESYDLAKLHKEQLLSAGLTADIEKVEL